MGNAPNVLFAGGGQEETALLIDELQRDGHFGNAEHVENLAALERALDRPGWHAVIADAGTPGLEAAKMLDLLQERGLDVAFLVVSYTAGEGPVIRMMTDHALPRRADSSLWHAVRPELHEALTWLQQNVPAVTRHPDSHLIESTFASRDVAIAVLDSDLGFVRVNRAYALAGQRDPEWFAGRNHFALYPNTENEALFRHVLRSGVPLAVFAKPFVYPDQPERGTTYWDWTLQPVRDEADRVDGLVLSLVDVTERERARKAAEQKRRHLYSILDKLPGFITVHSPATHELSFLNEASRAVFGDLAGRPCYEVMGRGMKPCSDCESLRVLQDGAPRDWEWASPTGRVYHIWGIPFSDLTGGELVLRFGVDVTRRHELEKEILSVASAEREGVGQYLHDSVGQTLAGVSMLAEALTQRLMAAESPEANAAAGISEVISLTVRQIQGLAGGLCPVELGEWGIQTALRRLADETNRSFGVPCVSYVSDDLVISDKLVADQLYQIAQGVVSSALTSALPSSIVIVLKSTAHGLTLSIEHDGVPPSRAQGAAPVSRLLKHRASMIGASIDMYHHPEGGTTVACTLPGRVRSCAR